MAVTIYKVSPDFYEGYNFLRTRSSPDSRSTSNVLYTVPNRLFSEVEYHVIDSSEREWYKIQSVKRLNGTEVGGAGWVTKQYEGVCTLMPRPRVIEKPGQGRDAACSRRLGEEAEAQVREAARQGRGGMDPGYLRRNMQNPALECMAFNVGVAAWSPEFDGRDSKVGLHVRICMRKGIHAKPGNGLAMVQSMHSAMWGGTIHYDRETSDDSAGQQVNYSRRSDVLVVFLSAVEGAEKAHRSHGYTYLGKERDGEGLRLMYFQDGTRTLSEEEVLHLYNEYCPC